MLIDGHVHAYTRGQIARLLASMRKCGIDKSVIMYWPWPNIGRKETPWFDEVVANVKRHRNLFLAGSIRVTDDKNFGKQLQELDVALADRDIVAVKIYLGYEHVFANDARLDPVYELCSRRKAPVIFHTGDTWSFRNALVRFANPIYVDDVALKFEKLKMVLAHMGNPCWFRETAEAVYKNKNVFADFAGTMSRPTPFERACNEDLRREIMALVAYCGTPRKLLFGTDFDTLYSPYGYTQESYLRFLEDFEEFSKTDMEYVRHRNAEKLFGI